MTRDASEQSKVLTWATHGPDAAMIHGHSRSTTDLRTFVTSAYVSARRAKWAITDLPSWG